MSSRDLGTPVSEPQRTGSCGCGHVLAGALVWGEGMACTPCPPTPLATARLLRPPLCRSQAAARAPCTCAPLSYNTHRHCLAASAAPPRALSEQQQHPTAPPLCRVQAGRAPAAPRPPAGVHRHHGVHAPPHAFVLTRLLCAGVHRHHSVHAPPHAFCAQASIAITASTHHHTPLC